MCECVSVCVLLCCRGKELKRAWSGLRVGCLSLSFAARRFGREREREIDIEIEIEIEGGGGEAFESGKTRSQQRREGRAP